MHDNSFCHCLFAGKTYRLRISNVGLQNSLNFRIQNHKLTLVEVEGTHTLQTSYSSLDVHPGQSYSVLVTADQPAQDYYVVVSSRFTSQILTTTAILRYSNSAGQVSGPPPGGPTIQIDWSLNQARSIRYAVACHSAILIYVGCWKMVSAYESKPRRLDSHLTICSTFVV